MKTGEQAIAAEQAAATRPVIKSSSMQDILLRARVADGGGIVRSSGDAYNWESAGIFGAAEKYPWPEDQSFSTIAQNYLNATAEKCAGDFAYTLGDVKKIGISETAEAEIACIDGKNDAAAALLFVADAGKLVVITHEGATDQMPAALEKRAQVVSSLK